MSKGKNDPHKVEENLGDNNGDRGSQTNERRQPKDTRFKKGRSGNNRGRPPKKIVREHDNPAIHHLMKQVKATGSNGKIIEGRALDLICSGYTNKALKGDIKYLDKLIEIGGGPQAIAFLFEDLYRSARLRDDDPDSDEGGPGSDSPPDRPGGDDREGGLDSPESNEGDEGDVSGGTAYASDEPREIIDPNDETIWNRVEAAFKKLTDLKVAEREARKADRDQVRKRHRKEEPVYFRDGKLVDEFDTIRRNLADPEYVHKPHIQRARQSEKPPSERDFGRRTPGKVENALDPWEAEFRKGDIGWMCEEEIENFMQSPDAGQSGGDEPSVSSVSRKHPISDHDGETSSSECIDEKGRRCVMI